MVLFPDGRRVGTVGGGAIEHEVVDALAQCIADGKPRVLDRDLTRDLGMCCGGQMEVFVEPVEGTQRLLMFGAGHVAQPTARIARSLGFDVTVVDDREELVTEARFPGCRLVLAEPAEGAAEVAPRALDWVLIVTHDHRLDEEALDACARLPHRYIGLIGSRRKIVRILQRIHARRGLPPLDRVYAPVGLDIGAVTPEEIAVSICAELVALRHNRASSHMRCLDLPAVQQMVDGEA